MELWKDYKTKRASVISLLMSNEIWFVCGGKKHETKREQCLLLELEIAIQLVQFCNVEAILV